MRYVNLPPWTPVVRGSSLFVTGALAAGGRPPQLSNGEPQKMRIATIGKNFFNGIF
jgi:hypothetical protein